MLCELHRVSVAAATTTSQVRDLAVQLSREEPAGSRDRRHLTRMPRHAVDQHAANARHRRSSLARVSLARSDVTCLP
jgi:hypothetical protein